MHDENEQDQFSARMTYGNTKENKNFVSIRNSAVAGKKIREVEQDLSVDEDNDCISRDT